MTGSQTTSTAAKARLGNHGHDTYRKSWLLPRQLLPLLYIALGLLAAAPLWGVGIVNTRGGGDSPFLLQRTLEMAENLRHGHIPARWMPHAAYGLGYPFFHYYAALPYYLSGALTLLGLSPLVAIQATQTLGFVLAALGMAAWARTVHRRPAAVVLAVAAYTFAPFHLVNVYVRGDSLSEFYAFVWYPLILWTLHRYVQRPTLRRLWGAALAYGALILTHNVSALIFSPFALLYVLNIDLSGALSFFRAGQEGREDKPEHQLTEERPLRFQKVSKIAVQWLRLALPFLAGLLLTAWFWLPALAETGAVQLGEEFTADYFHYSNHFRGSNLVQGSPAFDYSVAGQVSAAGPFAMGGVQAVLAALGLLAWFWQVVRGQTRPGQTCPGQRRKRPGQLRLALYAAGGLALATLMITPLSEPLWAHLPLLSITQFPWRFLSVQALFTAILTGALGNVNWKPRLLAGAASLLLIGAALFNLRPDRLRIGAEDVSWETLLFYETFSGNIGTTIRHEYLPQDVVPRPYISDAVVDGTLEPHAPPAAQLRAQRAAYRPGYRRWQLTLAQDATVTLPLHWWPGWRARVDGRAVDVRPASGSGRASIRVPAGEHEVILRLGLTPLRAAALAVSVVSAGVGLAGLFLNHEPPRIFRHPYPLSTNVGRNGIPTKATQAARARLPTRPTVASQQGERRRYGWVLLVAVAVSLVLPWASSPLASPPFALHQEPAGDGRFFDFVQMPYPHVGPVSFPELDVLAVGEMPQPVVPGERLDVPLEVVRQGSQPLSVTLSLVSPAEPRHSIPYRLASVEVDVATACPEDAPCTLTPGLALPDNLSRGLYLLQLRVFGPEGERMARTAQGRGRGTLYVGAVRVEEGPPLPPTPGTFTDMTLHGVETSQPDPATLLVEPVWSTPGTARNWSLSLRLLDAAGRQRAQRDMQPGYGYLPTSLWRAGEAVTDRLRLPLPEGLAPGAYTLRIISYLQATMENGGQVDVPVRITTPQLYDLRTACCELERQGKTILCQAGGLALLGAGLPAQVQEGETLDFEAEWNALADLEHDWSATWELRGPDGAVAVTQSGPVAVGATTTSWPRHTWVREPLRLELPPQLPSGAYTLHLELASDSGERVTCPLPAQVTVSPRPRAFDVPALPHPQTAPFGDQLRLLGYDYVLEQRTLTLTVWWQAQRAPEQDYKRFVHVLDPATEAILAQDDAMPRAWSYPTGMWAAGEVVSETLELDVSAAPAGEYRLAVGWYAPETLVRLPVGDGDTDRVMLDTVLELR